MEELQKTALISARFIANLAILSLICSLAGRADAAAPRGQAGLWIATVKDSGAKDGARNNSARSRQITVRVYDDAGKPVRGAVVHFQLPSGTPAVPLGGQSAVSVLTDKRGLARIEFQPNRLSEASRIELIATAQGRSSSTFITQVAGESAESAGGHRKFWRFLGPGTAAVILGILVANGSKPSPPGTVPRPRG